MQEVDAIRAQLFALQDKEYQVFYSRLMPTLPPETVIGVRVPLLRRLGVVVELYGTGKGCLIGKHPAQEDLDAAADGLKKAQAALQSGRYDLVILDEINVAWQLGLLQETQLEQLAKLRPQPVELVYTGRGCPPALLQLADLVPHQRAVGAGRD